MANFKSPEQASASTQGNPRYSPTGEEMARSGGGPRVGDATPRDQGQIISRLGEVWQTTQERLGRDDRRPAPTINQELRHGQQEMLGIGRDLVDIAQDLRVLVQQEMLLAKAEMEQQLRLSSRALAWGGITLVLVFLKLAFLSVAGMFALALVLPLWVSALIVAGVLFAVEIIAGTLAYRRLRRVRLVPQRTMESVKEDVRWISSQLKSNGK